MYSFTCLRLNMDVLHLLNKQKIKNKNLFGVFYKQKTFYNNRIKIDAKENKTIEPITNQYGNIPKIENDEIKKIDLDINVKSENDKVIESVEANSCKENIINQKPLSALNVISEDVITKNKDDIIFENISLPLIKDDTINDNINMVKTVNDNNLSKRKKIVNKNNIFKKFKKR